MYNLCFILNTHNIIHSLTLKEMHVSIYHSYSLLSVEEWELSAEMLHQCSRCDHVQLQGRVCAEQQWEDLFGLVQ